MSTLTTILAILVALEHLYIMFLETIATSSESTSRVFGSSIKKACEDLKAAYPDVKWKEGKLLNRVSMKDLEDWVK